ncbi:hypothetical protein CPB85DRAFT_1430313 [Mucidula mucida]|nr:hypothetical protein CPB85DRAFT_1430313 [Mucidula mucida]
MPAIRAAKSKAQPVAPRRSARLVKVAATAHADAPSASAEPLNVLSPSPSRTPTPTTVTYPAVIATAATVTISAPVLPTIVGPSAPTRKISLASYYVPRSPRDAFKLFCDHLKAQLKQSRRQATAVWKELSDTERLPYKNVAKAESKLFRTRFPDYKPRQYVRELKSAVEWSIDNDHLFKIDADGALQYAIPPPDVVVPTSQPTKSSAQVEMSPPRDATPEAPSCQLFFDWQMRGNDQMNAYQDTAAKYLPIPCLPYAFSPPAPSGYFGASAGPSSDPVPFYTGAPINPSFGPDFAGVYAGSHFVPTPTYGQFTTSSPAPMNPNTSYNYDQPASGSLLDLPFSD